MKINLSSYMKLANFVLNHFVIESIREESIECFKEYYYELNRKEISRFKIFLIMLLELILLLKLSLKIYLEKCTEIRNFTANTELLLRLRFLDEPPLDCKSDMPDYITWDEYALFLQDQKSGQFYSRADIPKRIKKGMSPVTGISVKDAYWFCAWMSVKTTKHPESQRKLYNYHFDIKDDLLKLTRVEIPFLYKELHTSLSYGNWSKADKDYSQIFLVLTGRERIGHLRKNDVLELSRDDFKTIDGLWKNFSGGKFGLTVQQEIYLQCEKKIENYTMIPGFEKKDLDRFTYESFEKAVGWRDENGEEIDFHTDIIWSLNAPNGHLPIKTIRKDLPQSLKSEYVLGIVDYTLY